jgi:hypothetical protein
MRPVFAFRSHLRRTLRIGGEEQMEYRMKCHGPTGGKNKCRDDALGKPVGYEEKSNPDTWISGMTEDLANREIGGHG